VGTTTTRDGIAEKQPGSDEDWQALRRHAMVLLEATNLFGSFQADGSPCKNFPSDGPGVFSSQEIQAEAGAPAAGVRRICAGLARYGAGGCWRLSILEMSMHFLKEGAAMDNTCEGVPPIILVPARGSWPGAAGRAATTLERGWTALGVRHGPWAGRDGPAGWLDQGCSWGADFARLCVGRCGR